jgi:hypothetical protein
MEGPPIQSHHFFSFKFFVNYSFLFQYRFLHQQNLQIHSCQSKCHLVISCKFLRIKPRIDAKIQLLLGDWNQDSGLFRAKHILLMVCRAMFHPNAFSMILWRDFSIIQDQHKATNSKSFSVLFTFIAIPISTKGIHFTVCINWVISSYLKFSFIVKSYL